MGEQRGDLAFLLQNADAVGDPGGLRVGVRHYGTGVVAGQQRIVGFPSRFGLAGVVGHQRLEQFALAVVFAQRRRAALRIETAGQRGLDAAQNLGLFVLAVGELGQGFGPFLVRFGHWGFLLIVVAMVGEFRVFIGRPAHEAGLQEPDLPAMGHAVLVLPVLDGHEAHAERIQGPLAQQGHGVAPLLGVRDARGDVQAVVAVLAGCDGADKGVVLVVELRGVEPLEDGVGVEGLAFAPHVDDVAERHGHALDGAPVAVVLGAGEHSPLESDFMLHRCLFLPVSLRAGACSPLSGLRPRSSRRPR